MSPVLKMREGAQFASNARFALLQYHPWHDRMEFMGMSDAEVKTYFRSWIEKGTEQACQLPGISPRLTGEVSGAPWYIREQYSVENGKHGGTSKDPGRKRKRDAADLQPENEEDDGGGGSGWTPESVTADSSVEEDEQVPDDVRVLRLLQKGNLQEVSKQEEISRRCKAFGKKHNYYRNTRCTNVAQEEQSVLPAGVINVNECAYCSVCFSDFPERSVEGGAGGQEAAQTGRAMGERRSSHRG